MQLRVDKIDQLTTSDIEGIFKDIKTLSFDELMATRLGLIEVEQSGIELSNNVKFFINEYFEKLADASPLPIMLYNIPVTTHLSMPISLVDKLSYHDNIVGFKDSERGDDRLNESLNLWKNRNDFTYHLGWAAMSSYGLQNGLDGIVPSSGNLVPGLYRAIYDNVKAGNFEEANAIQK